MFSKNTELSNIIKIRSPGTVLFHGDGRTDRHDEANSRFSHFCEKRVKAVQGWEDTRKEELYIEILYCTEEVQ